MAPEVHKKRQIVAIALGLFIGLCASGYAQEGGEGDSTDLAINNDEDPKPPLPAIGVRIIETEEETELREAIEKRSEERAQESLDVQKRASEATKRMADYTLYQTILSVIGTFALLCTLGLTLGANRSALRAARAAEQSVTVTQEMGHAQVRAYLGFEIISGHVLSGKPLRFTVEVKNHGQTPALNVVIATNAMIRPKGWSWGSEDHLPQGAIPPSTTVLHPGGSVVAHPDMDPPIALTKEIITALRNDECCVFASVLVFFDDVFRCKRETEFTLEFSGAECFDFKRPRISQHGHYDGKKRIFDAT